MSTYSFLDVNFSLSGPGGSFRLGSGSGAAEEGISVTMTEEKNTMSVGADGKVMHSLHAGKSGKVVVRLLKTSPVNAQLSQMYQLQSQSSALWGRNTMTGNDVSRGDVIACREVAFSKHPDIVYAKDGNTNEWEFMAGFIDQLLGTGVTAV